MFMSTFDFTHNALDVALRKLLMQISLPKETQQIDRVIEAFAKQYERCEPGLFGEKVSKAMLFHMTINTSSRQHICPCILDDDASHRCLQQA